MALRLLDMAVAGAVQTLAHLGFQEPVALELKV
jgi:hypothetical protein